MELNVFATLESILGLYSNVAIAWIGALVADLIINKPLGISPSYIEFKRAYLHNINPVGFGSNADCFSSINDCLFRSILALLLKLIVVFLP